jgi:hypothetical protein
VNLGEHDLGAARTNIDAYRRQKNVILLPKGIILEGSLVKVIIVVVVVVMARNVDMLVKYPIVMVGQGMQRSLIFRVFFTCLRQRCSPP